MTYRMCSTRLVGGKILNVRAICRSVQPADGSNMLVFSTFVRIIVCTRHSRGLRRWLAIFGRLLQNFSASFGRGGWVGERMVESEANLVLEKWGPTIKEAHNLVRLGRAYQAAEAQEAVSVVWQSPKTGWQARVVFTQDDWSTLEAELTDAFSEEQPLAV